MADHAAAPPRPTWTALAVVRALLLALAILLLWLWLLPEGLLTWAALRRRNDRRWRGFWVQDERPRC